MTYQGISGAIYDIEEKRLAGGGEGDIHAIVGNSKQVAKIFKTDKRDAQREQKLKLMVQMNKFTESQLKHITWPQDVIYNQAGFIGYVMPKVKKVSSLTALYSESDYDLRYRLFAAINLCAALDDVHAAGQICGDLNPQNICINLDKNGGDDKFQVTLVDTDSYHFVVGETTYRCEVGLQDYLAPEIQKKVSGEMTLKNVSLPTYTRETDLFALAVHIFTLLMNGCHPFACAKETNRQESDIEQMSVTNNRDSVVAPQPIENIKDGFFPFYNKRKGITIPVYAPEFSILPKTIQDMFIRTFVEGYDNPLRRPSAIEWQNVLMSYLNKMVQCDKNHYYFDNSVECPFCKINVNIAKLFAESSEAIPMSDSTPEPEPIPKPVPPPKPRGYGKWGAFVAVAFILLMIGFGFSRKYNIFGAVSETETTQSPAWSEVDFNECGIKMTVPNGSYIVDGIGCAYVGADDVKIMLSVRQNIYTSLNVDSYSLDKKPDSTLKKIYKKTLKEDGYIVENEEVVKLGNYYFIKLQYKSDDSYYCTYYALDNGMEYEIEIEILEPSISTISEAEKMIFSIQIYHNPIKLKLVDSSGSILKLSDEGLWEIFIKNGNSVNEEDYSVFVDVEYDNHKTSIEKLMLPPGSYSALLVHKTGEDYEVTERYDTSFVVSNDSSLQEIDVEIDK